MEDHRRNERTTYDYDHLNRLTLADTNHCSGSTCDEDRERFVYEFDSNSNRLESTDSVGAPKTSYAYNETNALCWSHVGDSSADCDSPPSGATDYDYDLRGNTPEPYAAVACCSVTVCPRRSSWAIRRLISRSGLTRRSK